MRIPPITEEFVQAVMERIGGWPLIGRNWKEMEPCCKAVIEEYLERTKKRLRPIPKKAKRARSTKDGRVILSGGGMADLVRDVYTRDCGICHLCGTFVLPTEAVADHIEPCGMGGARREDTPEAVKLAHYWCNAYRGSRRDLDNVRAELLGKDR